MPESNSLVLTALSRTYCCLGETAAAATGVTQADNLGTEQEMLTGSFWNVEIHTHTHTKDCATGMIHEISCSLYIPNIKVNYIVIRKKQENSARL